ncbi:hypothetical protein MMC20_004652 [Loxospora ochrophaea]|nr:hypothetical protein [Loxospora ochrophaea]
MLRGDLPSRTKALHDQYGSVVRTAPDELSFIDAAAWKDIYSHRDFIRPQQFRNRLPGKNADSLITANVSDHTRFRKVFGPAFTEKSIREQEPIIQSYIDKLMNRFHQSAKTTTRSSGQEAVVTSGNLNIVEWFNYTTFDIISDLGWGTSFRCLETAEYHPWITVILHFKAALFGAALKYYPFINYLVSFVTPSSAKAALQLVTSTAEANVKSRLSNKSNRPDIMSHAIGYNASSPAVVMTIEEMECNSMAFIVAGSEPVTTALVGTINCLLQNTQKMATLTSEIRSRFGSEQEINAMSTKDLSYLNAVLQEGLRMCPPVPDNMRRVVPQKGAIIANRFVPGGIVVSMPCWATFQSKENFTSPAEFYPERWLTTAKGLFEQDNKLAFQPFSLGPSNCIGQPLGK